MLMIKVENCRSLKLSRIRQLIILSLACRIINLIKTSGTCL